MALGGSGGGNASAVSGSCKGVACANDGGLIPSNASGDVCTEVLVGLAVNDGIVGLEAMLVISVREGRWARRWWDGCFVNMGRCVSKMSCFQSIGAGAPILISIIYWVAHDLSTRGTLKMGVLLRKVSTAARPLVWSRLCLCHYPVGGDRDAWPLWGSLGSLSWQERSPVCSANVCLRSRLVRMVGIERIYQEKDGGKKLLIVEK